ncbi:MAG: hypothetical protein GY830_08370, partial [Bacteroidetes bacterium]|nr:hypothetical protein [Bacteroidota bacterium]
MNEMNINDLTLDKLLELNELIVNRIKYLRDIESVRDKILFKKGEFVSFEHNNRYVI